MQHHKTLLRGARIRRIFLEHSPENPWVITDAAERADGAVVTGSSEVADLWGATLSELASMSARWLRVVFIDKDRNAAFASLSLEELLSIREEYLREASKYTLHIGIRLDARVACREGYQPQQAAAGGR